MILDTSMAAAIAPRPVCTVPHERSQQLKPFLDQTGARHWPDVERMESALKGGAWLAMMKEWEGGLGEGETRAPHMVEFL